MGRGQGQNVVHMHVALGASPAFPPSKKDLVPGVVVHIWNPSYWALRWEIPDLRQMEVI